MYSINSKTSLHFLFFFFIIAAYYIAKPIRNSLFLEWMGPRELPLAYLASAVVSFVAATGIHWLLGRVPPAKVIAGGILFFTAGLSGFRLLFIIKPHLGAATSFALYLFVSLLAVVSVSLFWAVCNNAHTPQESASSYSIIGIGGILGGLAGGAVTQALAVRLGTENLLLVSSGILVFTAPLPLVIERSFPGTGRQVSAGDNNLHAARTQVRLLFTPCILTIAAFVFLTTTLGSLMDYNIQSIIKNEAMTKDLRTAFFGRIFTMINIGGIVIHLTLTRAVLRKFGTAGGLLPLPVIAACGTIALWVFPDLRTVAILWVVYGAFAYSLVQVTRETLYTPVPRQVRTTAKFYIDTFIFRLGDSSAALLLLATNTLIQEPESLIYGYCLLFCALWVAVLVVFVKKGRNR